MALSCSRIFHSPRRTSKRPFPALPYFTWVSRFWPGLMVSLWFIWSFSNGLISCAFFFAISANSWWRANWALHLDKLLWNSCANNISPPLSDWCTEYVPAMASLFALCMKKLNTKIPRAMLRNKARVFQGYSYLKQELLAMWWRPYLQSKWGSVRAAKLQTTAHQQRIHPIDIDWYYSLSLLVTLQYSFSLQALIKHLSGNDWNVGDLGQFSDPGHISE